MSILLDEVHTQQEVRQELTNLWRTEVERYENSIGNQYNSTGTIQNANYFPYHTALYPLLDCYDSVAIATNALYYRVSPTPMPNENNGHRRSRFSTTRRVDRYGAHIEELALHEHLPNSSWAIRHLMPKNRRDQFDSYEAAATVAAESLSMQSEPAMNNNRELENVDNNNNNNLDNWNTPVRRDNYRFWNLIIDPVAETIPRSDISTPPNINDYEEEEEDDSGSWEDIDSNDDNGGEEILNVNDAVKYIAQGMHNIASNARDFTFLHWWQNIIIHERRGVAIHHNSISTKNEEEEEDSTINGDINNSNLPSLQQRYSPESLFPANNYNTMFANTSPSDDPTMILLRVLKHSLSDLQRDLRLARAILLLIADWRLCDKNDDYDNSSNIKDVASREEEKMDHTKDGVSSCRRLLTIISSEYIRKCNGYCHELYIADGGISDDDDEDEDYNSSSTRLHAPDHYCTDVSFDSFTFIDPNIVLHLICFFPFLYMQWWEFLGTLSTLLSEGITHITQSHANVICAFVILELNHANTPDVSFDALSGKEYLKRNLYFLNNAEQRDGTTRNRNTAEDGVTPETAPFNNNLLLTIISAVRLHALSDRMCIVKFIDEMNSSSDKRRQGDISIQLTRYLDSYRRCNNILVVIGERIALQLPCNIYSRQLGGMIVRGLVESFIGSDVLPSVHSPLSYLGQQNVRLRSLIDPRRYADAVSNSSNHPLLDPNRKYSESNTSGTCSIDSLIGMQPPAQVVETVKALFTADLVDLQVSGCGYGDFLIWCHLPVSPEPILFDYISNFPNLQDMDEHELSRTSEEWVVDEDGIELDYSHLSARYDFSLLVLLRQWNAPWTPDSHLSFSIPFRRSVSTLALCAHRFGVPHDIVALVNSYLPRSWWPDDRRCCWCRDCQMNTMKNQSSQSRDGQSRLRSERKEKNLITCSGCQVAMVCSKEHMKFLHRDGHSRCCGLPPFRVPLNEEDNNLCRMILSDETEDENNLETNDENDGTQEDDDGSWESVDSNEDSNEEVVLGKSALIFSFFNKQSYKLQQREEFPFSHVF